MVSRSSTRGESHLPQGTASRCSTPPCRRAAISSAINWGAREAGDPGAGRSGRPGRRHRRRGRDVQCHASDPGRRAAAGEHREGGEGEALGHGLPGWDPDPSGAVGRLAVLRDRPSPRIYTELPDEGDEVDCGDVLYRVDDDPALLLVRHDPGLSRPGTGAMWATTSVSSTGTCTGSATTPIPTTTTSPGRRRRHSRSSSTTPASTGPERSISVMRCSCPGRYGSSR